MNNLILYIVFTVGCLVKALHGQCTTAYGGQGRCKSLYSCEPLAAIAERRTPEDINILRKSHCGFEGNTPNVCCPTSNIPCTTPDQKPGQCIDIYECPHLAKLLQPPVSKENIQYVSSLRCDGLVKTSVCCGPAPGTPTSPTTPIGSGNTNAKCKSSVSAFPPDPDSKCCGRDVSFGDKIVGGSEAEIDQFPWSVLIEYASYYDGTTKLYCGGSLISGRYVLTAAHCLVGKILERGRPLRVRLGEHDTRTEGPDCIKGDCSAGAMSIPIEKSIVHPEYNYMSISRWNDIALIRLSTMAPYTEFIRPICLPTADVALSRNADLNFTVAGWGAISNSTYSSPVKMYVDLPYVTQNQCQNIYASRKVTLGKGQLCAGGVEGKDSCRGDSGNALMLETNRRTDAVGIVSFGLEECGLNDVGAIYTNVYQYLDWIRSNISP